MGFRDILVNEKNKCSLSPAVSKVSSGALEFMNIYSIDKINNFFENAKKTHKIVLV